MIQIFKNMKEEAEIKVPDANTASIPPNVMIPSFILSTANILFKAFVTSAGLASITYPISKISFNLLRYQNILGSTPDNVTSTRKVVMALYKGAHATLKANVVRGTYIESSKMLQKKSIEDELGATTVLNLERNIEEMTAKNIVSPELQIEQAVQGQLSSKIKEMTITASMSLIDTLVTKFIYMKSMLAMNGLQVDLKKWPNVQKAYRTGLGSQIVSGCISFFALCKLDSWYATKLQWTNQEKYPFIKGFAPGALAGMTSAVLTLPLNLYKDYACSKLTAENGLLKGPSASELFSAITQQAKNVGFKGIWDYGRQQLLKQLPLRMLNTSLIFGIISYVNKTLGDNPLGSAAEEIHALKKTPAIKNYTTKMFRDPSTSTPLSPDPDIEKPSKGQRLQK